MPFHDSSPYVAVSPDMGSSTPITGSLPLPQPDVIRARANAAATGDRRRMQGPPPGDPSGGPAPGPLGLPPEGLRHRTDAISAPQARRGCGRSDLYSAPAHEGIPMRAITLSCAASVALLSLCGCDAGNKPQQDKAQGPSLYVTSPRWDQVLTVKPKEENGKPVEPNVWTVQVMLDLRDYTVGPAQRKPGGTGYVAGSGQHVHVILDNEPYMAVYDAGKPVSLDVKSEGSHVVRVFPSAGPADEKGKKWHESWKNATAFAAVRFHVNKKDGPLADFDAKRPLLTYSRPKGEYKADGQDKDLEFPLMVDFWLSNVALEARGTRVRMTLDGGAPQEWSEWKPYFLTPNPPAGEHTVVLELIDRDGNLVEGPCNRPERTLKVTSTEAAGA